MDPYASALLQMLKMRVVGQRLERLIKEGRIIKPTPLNK